MGANPSSNVPQMDQACCPACTALRQNAELTERELTVERRIIVADEQMSLANDRILAAVAKRTAANAASRASHEELNRYSVPYGATLNAPHEESAK